MLDVVVSERIATNGLSVWLLAKVLLGGKSFIISKLGSVTMSTGVVTSTGS